jgi:hypothetical protein
MIDGPFFMWSETGEFEIAQDFFARAEELDLENSLRKNGTS